MRCNWEVLQVGVIKCFYLGLQFRTAPAMFRYFSELIHPDHKRLDIFISLKSETFHLSTRTGIIGGPFFFILVGFVLELRKVYRLISRMIHSLAICFNLSLFQVLTNAGFEIGLCFLPHFRKFFETRISYLFKIVDTFCCLEFIHHLINDFSRFLQLNGEWNCLIGLLLIHSDVIECWFGFPLSKSKFVFCLLSFVIWLRTRTSQLRDSQK